MRLFKIARKYRDIKTYSQTEDIFREFENLKNTNREILMFFSVMAKMIATGNEDSVEKMKSTSDKLITNVLIDYQNRSRMQIIKEQSIINDYVKNCNFKIFFRKIGKKMMKIKTQHQQENLKKPAQKLN